MKSFFAATFLLLCLSLTGAAQAERLLMATTTSTQNTGLLDVLAPLFEAETGIHLEWVAVGTGKALELGASCDVSVLMVHAPTAEKTFVGKGFGEDRRQIMYNDFVIAGPARDPAAIKGLPPTDALATIRNTETIFLSRGDNSGTHKKELGLWRDAGLPLPEYESWYVQSGQGMMDTLVMAAEMDGCVLTDRGTYITYMATLEDRTPLEVLVEKDPALFNQYSIIPINPNHCPDTDIGGARTFAEWMAGDTAQQAIADFKLMGKPLFIPNAE